MEAHKSRLSAISACEDGATRENLQKELQAKSTLAMTISGCQIAWPATLEKTFNVGYIEKFIETRLPDWEASRDRRAGGYVEGIDPHAQHFNVTNQSSIMALLAQVVTNFCRGNGDPAALKLQEHFCGIRVTFIQVDRFGVRFGVKFGVLGVATSARDADDIEFTPTTPNRPQTGCDECRNRADERRGQHQQGCLGLRYPFPCPVPISRSRFPNPAG